jgi:polyisoprenoid-binding protein YceI
MKKILAILFCCALLAFQPAGTPGVYKTANGAVFFHSEALSQNIDASNNGVNIALNPANNELSLIVPVNLFEFKSGKMKTDFNEDYMQTDEYPRATFVGKINEPIDYTKDGVYTITATGDMTVLGVKQGRTETGILTIEGKKVTIESHFKIETKDFSIRIPKILQNKVADLMYVPVKANLSQDAILAVK